MPDRCKCQRNLARALCLRWLLLKEADHKVAGRVKLIGQGEAVIALFQQVHKERDKEDDGAKCHTPRGRKLASRPIPGLMTELGLQEQVMERVASPVQSTANGPGRNQFRHKGKKASVWRRPWAVLVPTKVSGNGRGALVSQNLIHTYIYIYCTYIHIYIYTCIYVCVY